MDKHIKHLEEALEQHKLLFGEDSKYIKKIEEEIKKLTDKILEGQIKEKNL